MTDETNDELIEQLGRLPTVDLPDEARERGRRQAARAFRHESALAQRPVARGARRLYDRAVEPALLVLMSFGYLAWAVMEVQGILHP